MSMKIEISRSSVAFLHRNDIKIMLSVLKKEKVFFLHEKKCSKRLILKYTKSFDSSCLFLFFFFFWIGRAHFMHFYSWMQWSPEKWRRTGGDIIQLRKISLFSHQTAGNYVYSFSKEVHIWVKSNKILCECVNFHSKRSLFF